MIEINNNIYINSFWSGFIDKTDANHIGFFEDILKKTKISNYKITNNIDEANILFESIFNDSLINYKEWKYKIHYSGEPKSNNYLDYDIVLNSDETKNNVIDLPLFIYYMYGKNIKLVQLIERPKITIVPNNFCCFIVSNSKCEYRTKMFNLLNLYKKVDSYGKFSNNMGGYLKCNYWDEEFIQLISNYKFIICFENTKINTYITEKIINPFLANIIPIYWSTHHIKNMFNIDSILFLEDETDESYNNLINKIIELDNDDEKYLEYVNRIKINNLNYWNNYTIDNIANQMDKLLNK